MSGGYRSDMTGYPEQPTPTSDGDLDPADVVGQQAERPEEPDLPAEVPERTVPDQKVAPRTSETMPAAEGIHDPAEDPDAPE